MDRVLFDEMENPRKNRERCHDRFEQRMRCHNGFLDLLTFGATASTPDYPKPTAEETANLGAQTDLLNLQRKYTEQQINQQQALNPVLLQQLGITASYGLGGNKPGTGTYYDANGNLVQTGKVAEYQQGPVTYTYSPTPEQLAQREALGTQNEVSKAQLQELQLAQMLQPAQLEQAGYNLTRDENGKITGITLNPDSSQAMQEQVNRQLLTRTQQALKGELPVDPSLQRSFAENEGKLNEQMQKNLGPGYQTSTPYLQAKSNFDKRKTELLYSAQHGEISFADQLAQAGQFQGNQNLAAGQSTGNPTSTALRYQNPFSVPGISANNVGSQANALNANFANVGSLGTLSQLYSNSLNYFQQQRANSYNQSNFEYGNNVSNIFAHNYASSFGKATGTASAAAL